MLPPIESTERRAVIKNCIVVGLCAAILLPMVAWPSDRTAKRKMSPKANPAFSAVTAPLEGKPIVVDRDPFVAGFQHQQDFAVAPPAKGGRDIVGMKVVQGHPISSLSMPIETIHAIAIGRTARALVEINGVTRIVGVGDKIGSFTIKAILFDRVQLSNGSVLTLDREFP